MLAYLSTSVVHWMGHWYSHLFVTMQLCLLSHNSKLIETLISRFGKHDDMEAQKLKGQGHMTWEHVSACIYLYPPSTYFDIHYYGTTTCCWPCAVILSKTLLGLFTNFLASHCCGWVWVYWSLTASFVSFVLSLWWSIDRYCNV